MHFLTLLAGALISSPILVAFGAPVGPTGPCADVCVPIWYPRVTLRSSVLTGEIEQGRPYSQRRNGSFRMLFIWNMQRRCRHFCRVTERNQTRPLCHTRRDDKKKEHAHAYTTALHRAFKRRPPTFLVSMDFYVPLSIWV